MVIVPPVPANVIDIYQISFTSEQAYARTESCQIQKSLNVLSQSYNFTIMISSVLIKLSLYCTSYYISVWLAFTKIWTAQPLLTWCYVFWELYGLILRILSVPLKYASRLTVPHKATHGCYKVPKPPILWRLPLY